MTVRIVTGDGSTMKEKLKIAQSQTKFKNTGNTRMYYYGTEKEAESFVEKLKKIAIAGGQKERKKR